MKFRRWFATKSPLLVTISPGRKKTAPLNQERLNKNIKNLQKKKYKKK